MTSVELTGGTVVRPDGFELTEAWKLITEQVDERRLPVRARALVAADTVPLVRWVLGRRVRIGAAGPDGRVEVEVRSYSERALAGEVAGFGAAVEIARTRPRCASVGDDRGRTVGDLRLSQRLTAAARMTAWMSSVVTTAIATTPTTGRNSDTTP